MTLSLYRPVFNTEKSHLSKVFHNLELAVAGSALNQESALTTANSLIMDRKRELIAHDSKRNIEWDLTFGTAKDNSGIGKIVHTHLLGVHEFITENGNTGELKYKVFDMLLGLENGSIIRFVYPKPLSLEIPLSAWNICRQASKFMGMDSAQMPEMKETFSGCASYAYRLDTRLPVHVSKETFMDRYAELAALIPDTKITGLPEDMSVIETQMTLQRVHVYVDSYATRFCLTYSIRTKGKKRNTVRQLNCTVATGKKLANFVKTICKEKPDREVTTAVFSAELEKACKEYATRGNRFVRGDDTRRNKHGGSRLKNVIGSSDYLPPDLTSPSSPDKSDLVVQLWSHLAGDALPSLDMYRCLKTLKAGNTVNIEVLIPRTATMSVKDWTTLINSASATGSDDAVRGVLASYQPWVEWCADESTVLHLVIDLSTLAMRFVVSDATQ